MAAGTARAAADTEVSMASDVLGDLVPAGLGARVTAGEAVTTGDLVAGAVVAATFMAAKRARRAKVKRMMLVGWSLWAFNAQW